jgi:predicted NAD/FAD-dependent oxidoreductase
LDGHEKLAPISDNLKQLTYQPICTLYLQYPHEVSLTEPMLGLNGMTGQWIFDRRFADQPGLMAVVISAEGPHMRLDTETLAQLVIDELSEYFDWPEAQQHLVVREKRATFSACVDVDALRPDITTPVEGLWLAGDYTRSPYPSTLEAAVRSGVQCAQAIIQHTKRKPA